MQENCLTYHIIQIVAVMLLVANFMPTKYVNIVERNNGEKTHAIKIKK